MNSMIYDPLEEFENDFKQRHSDQTKQYFEDLVRRSKINIEKNRETVKEYRNLEATLADLQKTLNLWRVLRVFMVITLFLIPLVVIKITPKIQALRNEIKQGDKQSKRLLSRARRQMKPLNRLFTDQDALRIIESTIPMLSFAPYLSEEQEANMVINYDFDPNDDDEQSTVDLLAGQYHENPFLFETKRMHRMGKARYHGCKTIHWTETDRDSDGKTHTRTRSETLHATVTKPKPFYTTVTVLNYCHQGGAELSFSREATHIEELGDKALDRYLKNGEKKLKMMTNEAINKNREFVGMSNSAFEVLFDALDRTDEVQFRTLFTPLAQTNMVDLIRSCSGYGDDFSFEKQKRTNRIVSQHSQGRTLNLPPEEYCSYSFDEIQENFIKKNANYFKAVYFDFAPLLAIPLYQEKPLQSLQPIPEGRQTYSYKTYEALSNHADASSVVHPCTQTPAILKTSFVNSENGMDEICVTAYSYDIVEEVDYVSVFGGDGYFHEVPVPWDHYIPLEERHHFFVAKSELAENHSIFAQQNGICIFD